MNAVDPQPMINVRLNLEEGMPVVDSEKVIHCHDAPTYWILYSR